jgi:hypothetical protein
MTVLERIKQSYEDFKNLTDDNVWGWLSNEVFDLTTYDEELDEMFGRKMIEVCKVILEGKTFEYIRNREKYVQYILACQPLEKHGWINWGTSIRGSFFEDCEFNENAKELCSCCYSGDKIPFTKETLKELIKFIEAESGEGVEL